MQQTPKNTLQLNLAGCEGSEWCGVAQAVTPMLGSLREASMGTYRRDGLHQRCCLAYAFFRFSVSF